MLTVFRRHKRSCEHWGEGRKYRRCRCPISVEGDLGGRLIRQSLKTGNWERAQGIVREWEAEGRRAQETEPVRIEEATEKFLADARARGLAEQTVYKYDLLFRQLKDFARRGGYGPLRDLDVDALTRFRGEWKDGPRASGKKLERLRAFLGFCRRRRWIEENPAAELKPPKAPDRPTMPYTHDELVKILAAVEKYGQQAAHNARLNAVRLRVLILLLRYSGMRIGDAVSLTLDRISGDNLFLYTAKTGVPVRLKLPAFVVEALRSTPPTTERYWFWTGIGKLHTAVKVWETRLRRLFLLAEIRGGHAHRFRDTFAVELLLQGVPLERVSVLLGHRSIRVTERHYAPWVRARQEQLEADLERVWARDPLVLLQTNHTPDTHGRSQRAN
jgi:integrase/recombinase XerD